MGDSKILNIYDYMNALSKFAPGDTTDVLILRNNQEIGLKVSF